MKWGVFRNDFFSHGSYTGICSEAMLGNSDFQGRIPARGIITGANSCYVDLDNQASIDWDNQLANWAGIDHWIFNWQPQDPTQSYSAGGGATWFGRSNYGLQYYLTSAVRGNVKFSINLLDYWMGNQPDYSKAAGYELFSNLGWNPTVINQLVSWMGLSYWQYIGGRPLLYCMMYGGYNGLTWANVTAYATAIGQLKTAVHAALGVFPYLVGLRLSADSDFNAVGFDAISEYNLNPTGNYGMTSGVYPFSTYASGVESEWTRQQAFGYPVVPCVSCGWDPRLQNTAETRARGFGQYTNHPIGPSYPLYPAANPDDGAWTAYATDAQLATLHSDAAAWTVTNSGSVPPEPIIVTYAWNENTEGRRNLIPTREDWGSGLRAVSTALGRNTFPTYLYDGPYVYDGAALYDSGGGVASGAKFRREFYNPGSRVGSRSVEFA